MENVAAMPARRASTRLPSRPLRAAIDASCDEALIEGFAVRAAVEARLARTLAC